MELGSSGLVIDVTERGTGVAMVSDAMPLPPGSSTAVSFSLPAHEEKFAAPKTASPMNGPSRRRPRVVISLW